jgi:NAD(P)-dependent dehydrogenase (short-subunit alcohol dehydrogenase family)
LESVEGKVAVVTGAASGIGLGMARAFTGAGMRVVLADFRADALSETVDALRADGHEVIGVPTDVSELAEVEALATAALDTYGAVHVLCNNAGVGLFAPISRCSIDDWEWTLSIDLWGPIYGVKTFLPIIEQQPEGHINSTSSLAGLVAGATAGPYNVAKHGVVALMATLERELRAAKSPVRTSVLCPAAVNTDISANSLESRRARRGVVATRTREGDKVGGKLQEALARGMDPDDVGHLVLDAILNDRFWVFTDPRVLRHLEEQVAAMIDYRSLTRLRLF